MKVRNNDIYITRGENFYFQIEVYNTDGTPYIIPPTDSVPIIAFTIKPDTYRDTALEKYINLHEYIPRYNSEYDYFDKGLAKFTSQEIKELGDNTPLTLDIVKADIDDGNILVYHSKIDGIDVYQHGIKDYDGNIEVKPYEFVIPINLDYYDTHEFIVQNYTYDVILYIGELSKIDTEEAESADTESTDTEETDNRVKWDSIHHKYIHNLDKLDNTITKDSAFPLNTIALKRELVGPKLFIIEPTNNK